MKWGLGTAQFGSDYGVSNTRGKVPRDEAEQILTRAHEAGFHILDMADDYGWPDVRFRVCHKLTRGHKPSLCTDIAMVHHAQDLDCWPYLERLKADGRINQIGFSAYAEQRPLELAKKYKPDVVQLPYSICDFRLDRDIKAIKDLGVEIHARSIFAQGYSFLNGIPIRDAIEFVKEFPEIDVAIVGVTSVAELDEIVECAK